MFDSNEMFLVLSMKKLQLDLIISAAYQSTSNSGNEKMQFAKSQLSYQQHKT